MLLKLHSTNVASVILYGVYKHENRCVWQIFKCNWFNPVNPEGLPAVLIMEHHRQCGDIACSKRLDLVVTLGFNSSIIIAIVDQRQTRHKAVTRFLTVPIDLA